ncbi:DUF3263 domain-containing protein [Mycolicibacterium hippocampi]|uniref:DUF3263 domain-containing protein n=1 Tax=Mycolicibacterium hippocampi TaxID=659824 RepID=UPI003513C518
MIAAMGLSPTRYYQLLNRLLAAERAVAYAAVTVHRLRRIRTHRQMVRASSTHE